MSVRLQCREETYTMCVGTRISILCHSGYSSLYRVLKYTSPVYLRSRHNPQTDIASAGSLPVSISLLR